MLNDSVHSCPYRLNALKASVIEVQNRADNTRTKITTKESIPIRTLKSKPGNSAVQTKVQLPYYT